MNSSGSNRKFKLIVAVSMIVLLLLASFIQPRLNRARSELQLTDVTPLENAPPVLAFTTVALGGFRGLIANVLWIRANELQEEGKYFEMVQLADWITKLQPRMVQVWLVQAWNMAYNISVKFPSHPDRWRWVKAGIELLRDGGLRYNPDEAMVYRELAWFFQHKMGHYLDNAHMYYKNQWAQEMLPIFGREQPDWDALINPETEEEKRIARLLREQYKMDPQIIREIDDEYGPLEWKLPESHAIYWATVGLKHAEDEENYDTLRRVIYQCMDVAFFRGRLITLGPENFVPAPNLEIVDKTNQAYLDMIEMEGQEVEDAPGYKSFLQKAVYTLYSHNHQREAENWFGRLKEIYPDSVPQGQTLDEFALAKLTENVEGTDQNKTVSLIQGQFMTAFYNLAIGEFDTASANARLARAVWFRYMEAVGCLSDPPDPDCERVRLQPLEDYRSDILAALLNPNEGLAPEFRARLLTELGITNSVPEIPSTNAIPTNALPESLNAPLVR